jgi:aldose 1-epimerase
MVAVAAAAAVASPVGGAPPEFTLENGRGMVARLGAYGARLLSLAVPDRAGTPVPVVLGFATHAEYLADDGFLGASIGRVANRIAGGRFTLEGRPYQVPPNNGPNALHGGPQGFDKAVWQAAPEGRDALTFTHPSPDGDQGFPGALRAAVRYRLEADALSLEYRAECDRTTVVNLTNHSYFNLAGEGATILDHVLTIPAEHFTPVDATLIPTGELRPVAGTPFDFRSPTRIGARIDAPDPQLRIAGGYDHNFVLPEAPGLRLAARLEAPGGSGLAMEVLTTEPGLQFYSGNFLDGSRRGRGGAPLRHRGGLCLETQHFPDAPNQPGFPSVVLRPGQVFRSRTLYRFSPA